MALLSFGILTNLPNFILSACLYIFACVCLENHINKEDIFYCSSCKANSFFRSLLTIGYIVAALATNDQGNSGGIKVAITIYTFIMIAWYYRYGSQLYPAELMSKGMLVFMSLLITTNILIIENRLVGGTHSIL